MEASSVFFSRTGALMIEGALFGRVLGAFLRPLVRRFIRPHLAVIEPEFDPEFYVRQFADRRRAGVARAPLLHYAVIGWREGRPPVPKFDPAFYRRSNRNLAESVDPLLHYASIAAGRAACNEVAQRSIALAKSSAPRSRSSTPQPLKRAPFVATSRCADSP